MASEITQAKVLQGLRAEFIGVFDTEIQCTCATGHVIDHAIERPYVPTHLSVIGQFEPAQSFVVDHIYHCSFCTLDYDPEVIEGHYGYVPLEKKSSLATGA